MTFDEELHRAKLKVVAMIAYADEMKQKSIEILCALDDIERRKGKEKEFLNYDPKVRLN